MYLSTCIKMFVLIIYNILSETLNNLKEKVLLRRLFPKLVMFLTVINKDFIYKRKQHCKAYIILHYIILSLEIKAWCIQQFTVCVN